MSDTPALDRLLGQGLIWGENPKCSRMDWIRRASGELERYYRRKP